MSTLDETRAAAEPVEKPRLLKKPAPATAPVDHESTDRNPPQPSVPLWDGTPIKRSLRPRSAKAL